MSAAPDLDAQRLENRQLLRRLLSFDWIARKRLRKLGAFATLERGPWDLFDALVGYMNVDTIEAFPSQETLADEIEVSVRSVERWTPVLVKLGIINEPRVLRARGVLHYELGPAAYAAVREYIALHPTPARAQDWEARERIERLELELAAATAREQNAAVALLGEAAAVRIRCIPSEWRVDSSASAQPAPVSSEGRSLSRSPTPSSSSVPREQQESISIPVSEEGRRAARVVLAEFHARRFPGRAPRPAFGVDELELVGRRFDELEGDELARVATLRLAMDGAWQMSKGPPTTAYVFAPRDRDGRVSLSKFHDHIARGAKRPPPRELEPAEPAEIVDVAVMLADVAELFGPPRIAIGGT